MATLAHRIAKIRKDANMTMVEFAKRLRVSVSYISQLESGKPYNLSEHICRLIETEFKVNLTWLQQGLGEPYKDTSTDNIETILVRVIRGLSVGQKETLLHFIQEMQNVSQSNEEQTRMVRD